MADKNQYKYYLLYKPYGMLSQFTKEVDTHITLADLDFDFPSDVYPVGRLDKDSEGLLLLTNDKKLNYKLLDPKNKHKRTYLAQVEGLPSDEHLKEFKKGITIKVGKKPYKCLPAHARLLDNIPQLPERDPPIRFRKNVPTSWLQIELIEGKNRQVRKMCAKIGFPVLRLVRSGIETLETGILQPGQIEQISFSTIKAGLSIF